MAHALKRIAFATCFPDHHQFTFIAREPKATTDEQFCHAFRARSAREVITITVVIFLFLNNNFYFKVFYCCHCFIDLQLLSLVNASLWVTTVLAV